jgi:uncharacterized phage protein (TIGR02218 family)
MLTVPSALQAKLDAGVTTLCRCWLIMRGDGVTQGFTDHDEDVVVNGVTCRAASGLSAAEASQQLGLAVTGTELSGALADDTLSEADLAAGRYDAAAVEIWLVDWSEPSLNVRLTAGVLGEVRRSGQAFTAELRGLGYRFAEDSGRLFTATCNADLGDARCSVDLTSTTMRGEGAVAALTASSAFTASGLDAYANDWFTAGKLVWTGGANLGQAIEVKSHRVEGAAVTLELWQTMAEPLAEGDTFTVTAGCDKHFDTCQTKFANAVNFRGFPQIPGNDFLVSYPVPGQPGNSGNSLFHDE